MSASTAERPTGAAVASMVEVRRALETSGYADLVACFTPWLVYPPAWHQAWTNACDPGRAMLELFLLGRHVHTRRLPETIVSVLPHLEAAGLCHRDDEVVALAGLALHRFQGNWLFAQSDQASPTMYVGDDSLALASRLETRPGTALDLCAGPGIQSLVCASRGMDVVAVEINPIAAALAAVNAHLNALDDRVQVRVGDLYTCVEGERQFELVVANPPLLPIPAGVDYPFVGDGGPDGLTLTRRVLAGLPAHLAATGTAQMIGMTLSDGYFPHYLPELRAWCRESAMDVTWTTTHHLRAARDGWWVEGVASTSAGHTGKVDPDDVAAVADRLTAGYRDLDARAVCTYFLRVTRGTGVLRYVDVSVPNGPPACGTCEHRGRKQDPARYGQRPAMTSRALPSLKPLGWEPSRSSRRSPRSALRLLGACVRLVWHASPVGLSAAFGLFVVAAMAQVSALLALNWVLERATALGADLGSELGRLTPGLVALGLALAALTCAQLSTSALRPLLIERATGLVFERVLDAAGRAPTLAFDDPAFHERLSRANNAGGRPLIITQGLLGMLGAGLSLAGLVWFVVSINPLFVVPVMLLVFPMILVQRSTGRAYYQFASDFNEAERHRYYLRGLLLGRGSVAESRAYQMTGWIRDRHSTLLRTRLLGLRAMTARAVWRSAAGGLAVALAITASVWVMVWQVAVGEVSLAQTAVAAIAIVQLSGVVNVLAASAGQLYESSLFVNDYEEFERTGSSVSRPGAVEARNFGTIEVDRVSFTYPRSNRPALDEVSLTVRQGEVVALVGANGSGKTTLAKIISGVLPPSGGEIRWDGAVMGADKAESLRASTSVVFQDFGRYLFTVRDNITLGRADGPDTEARLARAARRAGADDFVRTLPYGYDTQLGTMFDAGVELSTGQWQRIALARALFRSANLLVLDEPTASLDASAEAALFEDIVSQAEDRTLVLISHRFSTVRRADRIYVLHEGRIVEAGEHDTLMGHGGRYAEMFTVQASSYLRGA